MKKMMLVAVVFFLSFGSAYALSEDVWQEEFRMYSKMYGGAHCTIFQHDENNAEVIQCTGVNSDTTKVVVETEQISSMPLRKDLVCSVISNNARYERPWRCYEKSILQMEQVGAAHPNRLMVLYEIWLDPHFIDE